MKACVCLHNWLIDNDNNVKDQNDKYNPWGVADHYQDDGTLVEGTWRAEGFGALDEINLQSTNNHSCEAGKVREKFCDYFNEEGRLWWQQLHIQHNE